MRQSPLRTPPMLRIARWALKAVLAFVIVSVVWVGIYATIYFVR